jgi:RNA polymerase sigma-70 factor (ECF subfamily)
MRSRAEPHAGAVVDAVDVRERVQWLYRRHRDEVYRLALRYGRGDPTWAEDVTQDVFVALCRNVHRLGEWDDLGRWFYRVTHNHCLSRLRRTAAKEAIRRLIGQRSEVDDSRRAEHRAGLRRVLEVVDGLEPRQRLAFCMYYLDGREQAEIGDILGCSKGYVCKLIQRARASLEAAGWEVGDG